LDEAARRNEGGAEEVKSLDESFAAEDIYLCYVPLRSLDDNGCDAGGEEVSIPRSLVRLVENGSFWESHWLEFGAKAVSYVQG